MGIFKKNTKEVFAGLRDPRCRADGHRSLPLEMIQSAATVYLLSLGPDLQFIKFSVHRRLIDNHTSS